MAVETLTVTPHRLVEHFATVGTIRADEQVELRSEISGVLREMRFAVPAQIATAVIGVGLWLTGLFLHGGTTS